MARMKSVAEAAAALVTELEAELDAELEAELEAETVPEVVPETVPVEVPEEAVELALATDVPVRGSSKGNLAGRCHTEDRGGINSTSLASEGAATTAARSGSALISRNERQSSENRTAEALASNDSSVSLWELLELEEADEPVEVVLPLLVGEVVVVDKLLEPLELLELLDEDVVVELDEALAVEVMLVVVEWLEVPVLELLEDEEVVDVGLVVVPVLLELLDDVVVVVPLLVEDVEVVEVDVGLVVVVVVVEDEDEEEDEDDEEEEVVVVVVVVVRLVEEEELEEVDVVEVVVVVLATTLKWISPFVPPQFSVEVLSPGQSVLQLLSEVVATEGVPPQPQVNTLAADS
ncbi:uncharacterized protein CCOS01_14466 [Colletotrichum costaricense]|uniref:Uncharacterized protein n=1 Tax=Colletotrichum costaricense TaxID=1209916 RepID=A0AAJ0DUF4_9PEZI|nr:uncharacterized protein CCOS01_14466 [Colletotrichum costaricense]KAK1513524.1 hypothetical protein CCOS01_14466 [Colletotrichum costaricense]